MTTTIKDATGVVMAGPDDPALARAKARDHDGTAYLRYTDAERAAGRHPLCLEDWSEAQLPAHAPGTSRIASGASVGAVSPRQAGILPTGRLQVSDAMVERGLQASQADGLGLVRHQVRAILEASLRG